MPSAIGSVDSIVSVAAVPPFLLTLSGRLIPDIGRLDVEARAEMVRIIGTALARRRPADRLQLSVFLSLLRWAPVLSALRPFDALSPAQQDRVLKWFENAPVAKLRAGFWGVKALILMGYYGRASAATEVGYTPVFDGNRLLG